jgi:hypothetical protein
MNTATGPGLTENDRYGDEVLNANGLPQMLLAALGLREPIATKPQGRKIRTFGSEHDAEDFMQRLYRAQE